MAGVRLQIDAGRFVAVVGRNGSGKSTLARLANGLLLPTEGRVLVAGRDTAHPDWNWEARRRVGVVFQNPDNQLVAPTVEEELAFGPENLGVPPAEIDARVERGLALSGLAGRRTQPPYMLSGGQKQLLAVAAVMAMQPDVLVLDEATAMLDPPARAQLVATALRLCREEGVAVLHVTHHMDEAAVADRVVALDRGRVAFDGPPGELLADEGLLARLGADVPPVVRMARELAAAGLPVQPGTFRLEELVEQLGRCCRGPETARER